MRSNRWCFPVAPSSHQSFSELQISLASVFISYISLFCSGSSCCSTSSDGSSRTQTLWWFRSHDPIINTILMNMVQKAVVLEHSNETLALACEYIKAVFFLWQCLASSPQECKSSSSRNRSQNRRNVTTDPYITHWHLQLNIPQPCETHTWSCGLSVQIHPHSRKVFTSEYQ